MVLLYSSHGKLIHDGVEKVMEQLSRKKMWLKVVSNLNENGENNFRA